MDAFEFWLIIRSFNVEKHLISECLYSLLVPLVCIIFSCVKMALIFKITINSLTRSLMRYFCSPRKNIKFSYHWSMLDWSMLAVKYHLRSLLLSISQYTYKVMLWINIKQTNKYFNCRLLSIQNSGRPVCIHSVFRSTVEHALGVTANRNNTLKITHSFLTQQKKYIYTKLYSVSQNKPDRYN